eukprot:CAMPEP_0172743544 /NCGR_PEP_ID=MMETSP1074-20121228/132528_1 /TAXON_ID=2916 /ORGANISM="Ceratium fusus, Strain PA161109" /LENGTH=43 /DNA_ID= /DNA_START= /DNA_END= /DNA_ORIENTATION=
MHQVQVVQHEDHKGQCQFPRWRTARQKVLTTACNGAAVAIRPA